MDVNNSTLLSQELREHILHLRRELTREDRSPCASASGYLSGSLNCSTNNQ